MNTGLPEKKEQLTKDKTILVLASKRSSFSEDVRALNIPSLSLHIVSTAEEASEFIKSKRVDLLIVEDSSKATDPLYFLHKETNPDGTFVVLLNDINLHSLESLPKADDYFVKPDSPERVVFSYLLDRDGTSLEVVDPLVKNLRPYIVFRSQPMKRVLSILPRIAHSDHPVLITGETGTGKELIARAIHLLSRRSEEAFITVNCGAIPDTLIEDELFGHEKGAFTGAYKRHRGKFELATKGTLFLDEIADMPLALQSRLLRAIEEGSAYRIGGERPVKFDVRIIAATRVDLTKAVRDGLFREDLYYRLNVLRVHLPPLRERVEDISLLAYYFLERAFMEMGQPKPFPHLSPGTIDLLERMVWKGNVRELRNIMTRLATFMPLKSRRILPIHIIPLLDDQMEDFFKGSVCVRPHGVFVPFGMPLKRAEELLIRETLCYTGGNITMAASLLGISEKTIRRKIKES